MKQHFSVGDKAVYPVHGVAEVVALEHRDIGGNRTPVYILKILDTGLKIMGPTTNAGSVGLRELITRLPGLRLAVPAEKVPLRNEMLIFGVHSLPVAWS